MVILFINVTINGFSIVMSIKIWKFHTCIIRISEYSKQIYFMMFHHTIWKWWLTENYCIASVHISSTVSCWSKISNWIRYIYKTSKVVGKSPAEKRTRLHYLICLHFSWNVSLSTRIMSTLPVKEHNFYIHVLTIFM